MPLRGERLADRHSGPEARYDGDDDKEEPRHVIIVAHIDIPSASVML